MRKALLWVSLLTAVLYGAPAWAQQEKGDREVGIGGEAFLTHNNNFGALSLQGSFGYYFSAKDYIGTEIEPSLVFTKVNGVRSTTGEVLFKGHYRRLIGHQSSKVFPFVGGGGGLEEVEKVPTGGAVHTSFSADGFIFGEIGFKSYLSQKTCLEVAYTLNFLPANSGSFSDRTFSQLVISIRHLF